MEAADEVGVKWGCGGGGGVRVGWSGGVVIGERVGWGWSEVEVWGLREGGVGVKLRCRVMGVKRGWRSGFVEVG